MVRANKMVNVPLRDLEKMGEKKVEDNLDILTVSSNIMVVRWKEQLRNKNIQAAKGFCKKHHQYLYCNKNQWLGLLVWIRIL